ncbi:MAG: class I SAM-dependent RNA methyltransferase, partial [Oscillospiraceae bacterium]|nr:class I SAM-dependent RNA methyltransferase [Oscillospiraceae bacterium]
QAVALARENARRAGVEELIRFEVADAAAFARQTDRGVIVTNPPYGERLGEKQQAEEIYRAFGAAWSRCPNWSLYLLSSHTELERCLGAQAEKKRKLYNGMIPCNLFMFFGSGR